MQPHQQRVVDEKKALTRLDEVFQLIELLVQIMGEIWDIQDRAIVVLPSMEGKYDQALMAMPHNVRQRWLRCVATMAALKSVLQQRV